MKYQNIAVSLIGLFHFTSSLAQDNILLKYGVSPCNSVTTEKLRELRFRCQNKANDFDFFSCEYSNNSKNVKLLLIGSQDEQMVAEMHFTKINPTVNYGYGLTGASLTYKTALKNMKAANIYPVGKKTKDGYTLSSGTVQWCESIENYYIINFNKQGKAVNLKIKTNLP